MTVSTFKLGDILSPIKGKKFSNDYSVDKLISVKIMDVVSHCRSKDQIRVRVLEGFAKNPYSRDVVKGDTLWVYSNAFELAAPKESDYECY